MSVVDRLLVETVRAYGYPVEIRHGRMGVCASGRYGGLWVATSDTTRPSVRAGMRELLGLLESEPDLACWRPWVTAAFKNTVSDVVPNPSPAADLAGHRRDGNRAKAPKNERPRGDSNT